MDRIERYLVYFVRHWHKRRRCGYGSYVSQIIAQIVSLLTQLAEAEETKSVAPVTKTPMEMLTIKECTEVIKGLSEHTVRQLVAQDKIPYIRTGQGKRGKILISKTALLTYFGGAV